VAIKGKEKVGDFSFLIKLIGKGKSRTLSRYFPSESLEGKSRENPDIFRGKEKYIIS
jgi:hypothetical protein